MRPTLIAVTTALAASSAQLPTADACGPYGPRAFLVSSYGVLKNAPGTHLGGRGDWTTRSFVHLAGDVAANTRWTLLAPQTYDSTRIAEAPDLEAPMTFTLVGRGGVRVVESRSRWFLDPAWRGTKGPALEVDGGKTEARVALSGHHTHVKWVELANHEASGQDVAFLAKQDRHVAADRFSVDTVPGNDARVMTVYDDGKPVTLVRRDHALIAQIGGAPIGALEEHGMTFLIVVDGGRVSLEMI